MITLTIALASCQKRNDEPIFTIVDLNVENLVVEELDENKSLEGVKLFVLNESNILIEKTKREADIVYFLFENDVRINGDELNQSNLLLTDAYAKEYIYNINLSRYDFNDTIIITQHKSDGGNSHYSTYVNYLTFNDQGTVIENGGALTNSYIFDESKLLFYVISSDGVELIDNEKLIFTGFPKEEDLIYKGKYINNVTFDLHAENEEGLEFIFKIRLAATNAPINVKTASFWNWIFLQMPIAYLMSLLSGLFNNSLAMGIALTTIIVRTMAWPIYAKSNDMSMKMNIAQPEIQKLEQKYANKNDPESLQKKQMEFMQIYKKYNIGFSGFFLPFLQMPIFLSMYQVVNRIAIPGGQFYQNVDNTNLFGTNLTSGGMVSNIVFSILVGITMFLLQEVSRLKPSYDKKESDSQKNEELLQQEKTMKMVSASMIVMMVFTAYSTPGDALSFYWIVGNIYSIGQTLLNRTLSKRKYEKILEQKF